MQGRLQLATLLEPRHKVAAGCHSRGPAPGTRGGPAAWPPPPPPSCSGWWTPPCPAGSAKHAPAQQRARGGERRWAAGRRRHSERPIGGSATRIPLCTTRCMAGAAQRRRGVAGQWPPSPAPVGGPHRHESRCLASRWPRGAGLQLLHAADSQAAAEGRHACALQTLRLTSFLRWQLAGRWAVPAPNLWARAASSPSIPAHAERSPCLSLISA